MASPIPETVSARDLLRHCLATIAYRAGKVVRDVPDSFVLPKPLFDFFHSATGEVCWHF